ncbi:hypothetical protein [Actinomadura decatromicini]|uniref:Uncharacterized protein n=1 Tax=Actinomadura decatromicini TaxID=2604572 RepID=A0A5D3FAJ0_9ACTN|nr:hypothetical protein [Actinomadura decatromicini]TYK45099.1 hypothetical protein FXF68_30930 [Actinomadura decatromicini]
MYVQAPPSPVRAKRGMSWTGHGLHWTLTIFTCGMWGIFYVCWWVTVRSWQSWRNWRNRKKHHKVYG